MATEAAQPGECARFAPSTTGPAHPGTLLAALLCWLDARSRGSRLLLRLEDLDHTRVKPGFNADMRAALAWFGLDWDGEFAQSELCAQHEAALDALAAQGRLYPCRCSRAERRQQARRAPDGGWAYANTCRGRSLPPGGWRACAESLRVQLDDVRIEIIDESGRDLSQTPAVDMGDPIAVRRDRVFAYHLVVVVDDGAGGVTRVVRGRDLAASTATQVALQRLLGLATPTYRHHFLLLEASGDKLAKFHGAVGVDELRRHYSAAELCGLIAHAAGLRPDSDACSPADLLTGFSWTRVCATDRVMRWCDQNLVLGHSRPAETRSGPE